MLDKQLYFNLTRRRRFKRLDIYGKRQRTVHEMCKRIIDQAPPETDIVIAFGNASWKQGKGYASSPRRLSQSVSGVQTSEARKELSGFFLDRL
ncbi:uncharacterized protein BJ171DRAFT_595340 [Polychytrium aggregatum]|uniref:uncharacterized protein n=1 Tax=Polychytrium aggregatum TaxID=110093 RepID=UPI0022FDC1EF|nr:uncharacterized protein BJ171DRAFT_595340 [Polychytrium aggregatum]KAI9208896.1 hypothetical protein BJ171DRAFT_595340 [Polychytrium aggregatum]